MKRHTRSAVAGGGIESVGMTRISTYPAPMSNHESAVVVAGDRNSAELLRDAFAVAARQAMVAVAPALRDSHDTAFLKDSYRPERRVQVDEDAIVRFVRIAARNVASRHALSDAIRAYEIQVAPSVAMCPLEAVELEQDADAVFDAVKLPAIRTKSPSRILQMRDAAMAVIRRLTVLVDSCNHFLARSEA